MERFIRYEKSFINIHTSLILVLFLHSIFLFFSKAAPMISVWTLSVFLFVHLLNIVLLKLNYFNKKRYYYYIKMLCVILIAYGLFNVFDNLLVSLMAISIYLLLLIEILIATKPTTLMLKILIGLGMVVPFILALISSVVFNFIDYDNISNVIGFAIFFICVLSGFIIVISANISELQQQVSVQTRLFKESKQANENLMLAQQQFKDANKQLEKQKLDLEVAYRKINRTNAEMFIQNELLRYISSSLETEELMEVVTDSIIGAIGVDTCSIIIHDETKGKYSYKVKSIFQTDYLKNFGDILNAGYFDEIIQQSQTILDNNVIPSKYKFLDDRPVGSLMIMPLIRNKKTYGLLITEQRANDTFIGDNLQFFEGIVTQINIAVNNASLYAKMEDMATRDGLTQVYNRAYLTKKFNTLLWEAVEDKTPLSVALFDIDKFKMVNDTYGHLFGDEVIKSIARLTKRITEENHGLVGRFGGEEFVLIFPNTPIQDAYIIIQRVHKCIQKETLYFDQTPVHINVSIGLASYPETCKQPEELLIRADWSMYFSKQNGGGSITIDNDEVKGKLGI